MQVINYSCSLYIDSPCAMTIFGQESVRGHQAFHASNKPLSFAIGHFYVPVTSIVRGSDHLTCNTVEGDIDQRHL